MNPATHGMESNGSAPVLYMALELSNKTWRLALSDGAKRRQMSVPAADLAKLACAVAKAKERFGMPASARVVSCYEAGRDGFWLHRHLRSVGIENEVVDAASIEVSRRLRHVKTDRLDGERLLEKPMRHHAGERGGWSVVRVPSVEEEDARHLHRELERLKRERLAHRVRMQSLLITQGVREASKMRRTCLSSIFAASLAALPATAPAQADFPRTTPRILVPFASGSAPDIIARTFAQNAAERLRREVMVENRTGAGGNIAFEAAAKTPLAASVPAPQILWSAGMETGSLSEWPDKVNSSSADSVAVTAASAGIPARSGSWVMRQQVSGSGGGTRMISYSGIDALAKAGTTFYVSWWNYYPSKITFGPSGFFSTFQICSRDSNGVYHPIWSLDFHPSNFTLQLIWNPSGNFSAEGPHSGESGKKVYGSTQAVPVRQWVFFEIMVKPSTTFTGAVTVWMNGQVLFDQTNVKTRFPDMGVGGLQYVQHTAYGFGLSPNPARHYVDDVTVSLGRMPYAP